MSNTRPETETHHHEKGVSLLQNFKGIVSTPSDLETYTIERWAPNVVKKAAYVVYPTDAKDISVAILFARSEKLPIAISGGRHNVAGASSTEGLVIDMRKMIAVRVDTDNKVGYIQGGATLEHAIKELFKYGMATVLGHAGSVGVVGLATGGGLGYKMGQHGLACDNIVSATMVLANGEIVIVDDEHHPDLLWGIKGGSSNFGVIVELGMRLHETRPDVHIIQHIYPMEQLQPLMEELTVWSKGQTPLETLFLGFFLSPDDGKPYIAIDGIGDFSAEEGERLWGRFLKFNPIKSKVIQPSYDTYTSGYDGFAALPGNKVQAPMFWTKFDYETVKKSFDKWLVATAKAPTSALYYDFFPLDLMASVPVEATAFAQRTTVRLAMVGIYGFDEAWTLEANQALEDIRACVSSSSTEEARRSIGHLNHSGLSSMDASKKEMDAMGRRAFGPNYPRLQQVKRKYDPDMVFNRWFCVRPADE